jgi:hypothetical protein
MSTSGILGGSDLSGTQSASGTATTSRAQQMAAEGSNAAQYFMNYMKETPAQQLEASWLAAHGLTQKEFDALPPAQKLAIEKQMEQDIKNEIAKKMQGAATGAGVGTGTGNVAMATLLANAAAS